MSARWHEGADALVFAPPAGAAAGLCFVHRRAFRVLVGREAAPGDCLAFYALHEPAFARAAAAKRERCPNGGGANFHINSRDIRRAIEAAGSVLDTSRPAR